MSDGGVADRTGVNEKIAKILEAVMVTAGAFLIGVAVLTAVVQLLTLVGARRLVVENTTVRFGLTVVMLQGVSFGTIALLYLRWRDLGLEFLRVKIPSVRDVAWMMGGFLLLVAVAAVVSQFLAEQGIESARNQIEQQGKDDPRVFLLMIPLAFLLIGPGEELLFRGIVQGSLRESFGAVSAVGITSLVFAVGHFTALTGGGNKFVYLAVVFGLSLILGWTYEDTDNLVVPSMIHGGYNALIFVSMYVSQTGMA